MLARDDTENLSAIVGAPDWVPPAVKSMAAALPIGHDVARRLLTDERMVKVWPALQCASIATEETLPAADITLMKGHGAGFTMEKIPRTFSSFPAKLREQSPENIAVAGKVIPPSQQIANLNWFERLRAWDIPDRDVAAKDQACAAFFAYAVVELGLGLGRVMAQSQADKFAKPQLDAAELLRWSIKRDPMLMIDPKRAKALEAAGAYLEREGRLRQQKDSAYVVKRSSKARGKDEIRAKTRALATATQRIFGSFLYGTVATVAMVALQVDDISRQDVRNWCADLPRQ